MKSGFIELHADAPAKPAAGEPCNRCGVCCAYTPCPIARLFLFQFKGSCRALMWQEEGHYACGMVQEPDRFSLLIPNTFRVRAGKLFAKRIAAGTGCDADIEIEE